MFVQGIVAVFAVGALALWPRSARGALVVVAAAAFDVALGAGVARALAAVAPMVVFLSAALTLAAVVERSGLAGRAACALAAGARGNAATLYAATCALCALLTAVVSLDGAVVLMVPVVMALSRRRDVPFGPLFTGVIVVANAASVAVPLGNPTNLVVIERLGLSPGAFVAHMLVPGLAAAALCACAVAVRERRALAGGYPAPAASRRAALSAPERHAALSLAGAALAAWAAALSGMAPWWPFAAAVVVALATAPRRPRLIVPWRVSAQVTGLLIATGALGLQLQSPATLALPGLVAVALATGAASALANNLPVSICAASLLSAGPSAYAALIGLGVGSLATPHGSLATLIAVDAAGEGAPRAPVAETAVLAACGVLTATVLLWAGA